jgi:RimJ/RimL family protein N-acetyltransferase
MSAFPASWPIPQREILAGRWCRLEPLDPSRHGDELYAATIGAEDDRLHRWLFEEPPASRADYQVWLEAKALSADPLFFAVIDQASGRALGRQTLMRITPEHGVAEIGNILWGPQMAGTRLATEALFLFADWVFGLGYRRFEWKCNAQNEPSRRAALRFGFAFEGVFRQHMVVKGANRDTAWFAMLDRDWPALRSGYERWLDPANFNSAGEQRHKLASFLVTPQ